MKKIIIKDDDNKNIVHAIHPFSDYQTLCNDDYDIDLDKQRDNKKIQKKRITCDYCKAIINYCRNKSDEQS